MQLQLFVNLVLESKFHSQIFGDHCNVYYISHYHAKTDQFICVNELEAHLIQKILYSFVIDIINIKYPKVFLKLSTKVYGRNVLFVYGYLFCPKTTWLQWPALPFTTKGLLLTSKYFTWPNPWEGESSSVVLFTKDELLSSRRSISRL